MTAFRSRDGLMTSSDPANVALWDRITAEHEARGADWTTRLRELGIKLAHPDDGWVDRRPDGSGRFSLSWYPQFNDHPKVGDLIAFGTPPRGSFGVDHYVPRGDSKKRWKGDFGVEKGATESAAQGYRVVRVTATDSQLLLTRLVHYDYEDTGIRLPAPPSSGWLVRALRRLRGHR